MMIILAILINGMTLDLLIMLVPFLMDSAYGLHILSKAESEESTHECTKMKFESDADF